MLPTRFSVLVWWSEKRGLVGTIWDVSLTTDERNWPCLRKPRPCLLSRVLQVVQEFFWDMLCKVISDLRRVCEDFLSAMGSSIGFSNTQVLWFQNWDVGSEADWEQRLSNVLRQENGWLCPAGSWLIGPPEATQQGKRFQGQ